MVYSRDLARDFWYEFDNYFMWDERQEVFAAIGDAGDILSLYEKHRQDGTFPEDFVNEIKQDSKRENSVKFLDTKQMEIILKHFGQDIQNQQRAFENFGQGVLFDDRKPRGLLTRVHMMDEKSYGFRRWHAVVRAGVLLSGESSSQNNNNRWLATDRYIGLAWEIQTKQNPRQSDRSGKNPNNPEIDSTLLDSFRSFWLSKSFDDLDKLFDNEVPQHG